MQKQIPKEMIISFEMWFYLIFYPEVKQIEIENVCFHKLVEDWDWHVSLCLLMILTYISTEEEVVNPVE